MANQIPVLNWEVHENLADHHAFLQKLKLFAVAHGWTCSKEEIAKVWAYSGGSYTWVAGAEDFMEFKSDGFVSQNLIHRIRLYDTGSGNAQQMEVGGHKYDTYNTASSQHPVLRNGTTTKWNYGYDGQFSVKRTSIPSVWLLGNEKIIIWVMKLDSTTCQCGCFGSINSYYSPETELDFIGQVTTGYISWENKNFSNPFDSFDGGGIYWRGTNQFSNQYIKINFISNGLFTAFANNAFVSMGNTIRKNTFSNIRPIVEQTVFGLQASGIWQPVGTLWCGRIYFYGLDIGEHVKYGTDEYIVFPARETTHHLGYAFRIN